jgi:hypothetical protein
MKIEHFVYADGQAARVKPLTQGIVSTDPTTEKISERYHDGLAHTIHLVTQEKYPYLFVIETTIKASPVSEGPETLDVANTWFPKLTDLLEDVRKYLPPTQVGPFGEEN